MQKIFSGEIYEILPLSNGVIFSYCREYVDNDIIVAYKMISFDTGRITDITKSIYLISKFGNNYKAVIKNCENYITVKSIILPTGKTFLVEPDGRAMLLDNDATNIWNGNLIYRGEAPSDIVLYNNSLWASYSECDALVRYNLATMREELRIGGNKSPFKAPKDLFVDGSLAYVSNKESKELLKVDLNNYTISHEQTFEEEIYQYVKVLNKGFVLLKSGLYVL